MSKRPVIEAIERDAHGWHARGGAPGEYGAPRGYDAYDVMSSADKAGRAATVAGSLLVVLGLSWGVALYASGQEDAGAWSALIGSGLGIPLGAVGGPVRCRRPRAVGFAATFGLLLALASAALAVFVLLPLLLHLAVGSGRGPRRLNLGPVWGEEHAVVLWWVTLVAGVVCPCGLTALRAFAGPTGRRQHPESQEPPGPAFPVIMPPRVPRR